MNDIAKAIEYFKNATISFVDAKSGAQAMKVRDLAIFSLEKQLTNSWIPVSERLPENKVNVLMSKESGTVKVGFCNVNYNEWREDGYLICPPIAWQPLPEKYESR